eukprot:364579-Chlamydomonas_euryale.AAC.3
MQCLKLSPSPKCPQLTATPPLFNVQAGVEKSEEVLIGWQGETYTPKVACIMRTFHTTRCQLGVDRWYGKAIVPHADRGGLA